VTARDSNGRATEIVGLDTDITGLKDDQAEMTELTSKMQLAMEVAGIGMWEYALDSPYIAWDKRMREIYGLSKEAFDKLSDPWGTHLHPEDLKGTRAYSMNCSTNKSDFKREYRIIRSDGSLRHIRSLGRFVGLPGASGKLMGVSIDITEDRQRTLELEKARKQLEHDSRHDALTGLGNRRLLDEATRSFLARSGNDQEWAVLHFDLDDFKQVNDSLGHSAGDDVLIHFAHILRTLVDDLGPVCRLGGDEFVVLLERNASAEQVNALCEAILDRVAEPLIVQGMPCAYGVSIGCALGRGNAVEAAAVFINADIALYVAKSEGRGCYRIFDDQMHYMPQLETDGAAVLEAALAAGEITCHYQPQLDPVTRAIVGAEALVRWNCPERGLLSPNSLLPSANAFGLIARVDEKVLELVLSHQTEWMEAGLAIPRVGLNISLERLLEDRLFEQLASDLKPHHSIAFELLETALWEDIEPCAINRLVALRKMGIAIDLDDFGAGHSSVVAMQKIQPDRVKIDRKLIAPLEHHPSQVLTLGSLVELARLDGCKVVVEGVETHGQLSAVATLGCEAVQGFLLAYPEDVEVFKKRLAKVDFGASSQPSAS